jgi:hypothetical protein
MDERSGRSGRRRTTTERDRFWLRHLEAIERSSQSASAYARSHGLSVGTLFQAKRRLVQRGLIPERRVSFTRVQVDREPRTVEAGPFRLRLASGVVLEWASAPGIEILGALIERVDAAR